MTFTLDASDRFAATWYAAARAGYATPQQWRDWADQLIIASDEPPIWLMEMSLAKNFTELRQALLPRLEQESQDAGEMIPVGKVTLGFHYLRYQRGDYTLRELLLKTGEEADGGTSDLDCEVIYQFLNELEEIRDSKDSKVVKMQQEVSKLFEPYRSKAEAEWSTVQKCVPYK